MKANFKKKILVTVLLSIFVSFLSTSIAANVSNSKSMYGYTLKDIGVRGTAYFDNGTGKFDSHGGFRNLAEKVICFITHMLKEHGKAIQLMKLSKDMSYLHIR